MSGWHKALQPSEVKEEWRDYILWDTQGTHHDKYRSFIIKVRCPLCGREHWLIESAIRCQRVSSMHCRRCANRKVLQPKDVPQEWRKYINWDDRGNRIQDRYAAVWVSCPQCGKKRLVPETVLRTKKNQSVLCVSCASSNRSGPNNVMWAGGKFKDKGGYVNVHLCLFEGRAREIAEQMADKRGSCGYVSGHRINMAIHLNRSLTKDEVVHHKDGNRAHNDISNLELLTKKTHFKGHGNPYYQKWQEALSRIEELEAELEILER